MIEIKDLKKSFQSHEVLKGISFSVEKGDVIAIIGPSGTGKSTLLRCLNLLEKPEEGSITFDDFSFSYTEYTKKELTRLRERMTMVFQSFNLFRKKTALENVTEGLITVKGISRKEAREIAVRALERVKMADRLNYYPQHLSGGQQQRVAIARALAMNPDLLLLDEPTSALDPELVGEVLDTIKDIAAEGHTMIIVSHEMNFVRKVATKVIYLENGYIVEMGTPEKMFSYPEQERTKAFLLRNNIMFQPEYTI